MHSEGTESSGEAGHLENKNIMAAIEDLQHSQVAMVAEFQSLHQETTIPQVPQGGQGPQGSPYLTKEDISTILFKGKKMESTVYVDTNPSHPEEIVGRNRSQAISEAAQALTRVMERNHEVVAVEGSLMQVAYQEVKDSVTFSNNDLATRVVDGD